MRRLLVVCLWALAPSSAAASAPELFGLGSEAAGVGGAMAARAQGWTAGYYNPAAMAGLAGPELAVGVLGFRSQLTIAGQAQPIADPLGILVGAATPVPFTGVLRDRLYVGIALYITPSEVVRVIARPPDEPSFPYYDNRTQRLVVLPSLAVRIGWGLSAGIALNFLAGLDGRVQATESAVRAVEPRVDEQVLSTARMNAGLRWRSPADRFAAALVYRQRFAVPFSTTTMNRVAGQPLDIDVVAEGLYTPDELVIGGAARPVPWLQLSADLTVGFWSAWRGPWVTVSSDLPIVGTLSAPPPSLAWRDTVAIRVGAEARRDLDRVISLRLRAGYGFETSPIPPDQPGITNLLDGPKHFLSLGAGIRFATRHFAIRLDAHGQLHVMQSVTLEKEVAAAGVRPDPALMLRNEGTAEAPASSNAGFPRITGGGLVWSAGLTVTVER